jgi:hypothetical protein
VRSLAYEELRASWRTDGGEEHALVRYDNGGWTAEVTLTAVDVHYVVRLGEDWRPTQLLLFRDLEEPDLWLATDRVGRWGEVNGVYRRDLDGCTVVGVAGSAFVHGLAVRAGGGDLLVAVVDPETLQVDVVPRTYTARGKARWGHDENEWDVDAHSLPIDLQGTHTRIATPDSAPESSTLED